jgi:carbon monoxide dehydrogenase subunit G
MCPAVALILMLAVGPQVRLEADHRTVTSSFRAFVAAPMHAVAHELIDPARLSGWIPGLVASEPVRDGFAAEWRLPWPLGRVSEVLRAERHVDGTDLVITWQLIRGDLLRHEVEWRLRAIGAEETEVIYESAVSFRRWVPSFLLRAAQRRAIPEAIRRLERRAQESEPEEVRPWTRIMERNASPRS